MKSATAEQLVSFTNFKKDLCLEYDNLDELIQFVKDNYNQWEIDYLICLYSQDVLSGKEQIELTTQNYTFDKEKYLDDIERKGGAIKLIIEYEDYITTLEGEEAKKWSKYVEQMGIFCTIHRQNPFDDNPLEWKIIIKQK